MPTVNKPFWLDIKEPRCLSIHPYVLLANFSLIFNTNETWLGWSAWPEDMQKVG